MHDKNLTPNILAAFAAGRHLRTKDAGDPIEMLASKFADFSDAAMKRLDNAASEMKGVRAEFGELEQKMARGGNYESMRPETWGAQFIDSEGSAVKSLSEHGSGKVSLMVKTATTAQTSVGALEVPTRDTAAMLPQRRLTIRNLLPVVSISTGSVEYVQQETRASGAAMVAEGAAKPESNMTLALKTTSAKVIAHWMKASRQALDDLPQLRDLIDNDLRYGLALTEETQILTGDGTGQNLLGLIPSATEYADPLSVANPTMVDVIGGAILQSALADFPADGIVIHPADWTRIRLLKDGDGKYLMGAPADSVEPRLFGLPVVATKAMGVGQFLVGSFAEAATLYDRWAPRVEVGYVNDDFTNNLVTILAEERLAMAVKQPLALTYGSFSA